MTLKQLEYFIVIAKYGNMSRASLELNISQPPLSHQIKLLEEELGCVLFTRGKKGMALTPAGALLLERSKEIFKSIEKTIFDIRNLENDSSNVLKVGSIASIANTVLPSRLSDFCSSYPNTKVQIIEGGTNDIINMLNEGTIEFGIAREPSDLASFSHIVFNNPIPGGLEDDCYYALFSAGRFDFGDRDMVNLRDLCDAPILIHRYHEASFSAHCLKIGFLPSIVSTGNDMLSLINWAKNGRGIAIMPYTSSLLAPGHGLKMQMIVNPIIISRRYILWNKNAKLSEAASKLIKLL